MPPSSLSHTFHRALITVLGAAFTATAMAQNLVGLGGIGFSNIDDIATNVAQVAAGADHTVALKTDGTVACWGSNAAMQCNVPLGLAYVAEVAGGSSHSVARTLNGSVVCWGSNTYGQCGVPAGLGPVARIAAGIHHTVAVKVDGSVAC